MPSVQTWVSVKGSEYLQQKLNTEVSIQGVDISIFDHIILEKFYIEDLDRDTLLYVDKFNISISNVGIRKEILTLKKIHIKNLVSYIKSDTAGVMNYQFIIDAFESEDTTTTETSESNWKLKCDRIIIDNSQVSYYMPDTVASSENILNPNDIKITDFNFYAKHFFYAGNSIMLDIDSLRFKEKSGFTLNDIKSKIFYGENRIDLNELQVITGNSKLYFNKLKFGYENLDAFNDFFNLVKMDIRVADSTIIGFKDASYFSGDAKNLNQKISLETKLRGTLSDLTVEKFIVKYGNRTKLATNLKIKGLPDINNTDFNINIDTLSTSINDILSFKDAKNKSFVPLPSSLKYLGDMFLSAKISGTIHKTSIKSNLNTGIGDIKSYFLIKQDTINKSTNINGNFIGKDLIVSDVIENKDVGRFNLTDTVDMTILKDGNLQGYSKGLVTDIFLYGYSYNSISFNANVDRNLYKADVKINDPNIKLDIKGVFTDLDSLSETVFNVNLKKFKPFNLKFYTDTVFSASLKMLGSIKGTNPDYMDAKVSLDIKQITNKNNKLQNKKVDIKLNYNEKDSTNKINLISDFLDVYIEGKLKTATIADAFQDFVFAYMPSISDSSSYYRNCNTDSLFASIEKDNNIEFKINIKDINTPLRLFVPGITLKEGTYINGKFNPLPNEFYLEGYCPRVVVYGTKLEDIYINGENRNESLSFYINTKKLFLDETRSLDNSLISANIKEDSVNLGVQWNSFLDSLNYVGDVSMKISLFERIEKKPIINIKLDSSSIGIEKSIWAIKGTKISIDTNIIELGNINAISNNNDKISISGRISESNKDTLSLSFDRFDISILNSVLSDYDIKVDGILYGKTKVVSVLRDIRVNSIDSIIGFRLNDQKIGRFFIDTKWDNKKSLLSLYSDIRRGKTKNVEIKGDYYVKKDDMNFDVEITRFPFIAASPFVKDYVSNIVGKISGKAKISGSSEKPIINAGFKFIRSGFKIIDLNTFYTFTDSLFIENSKISFKKMKINAGRNSYAWVSGLISHKDFTDFNLDINVDARHFKILDTKQTESAYFYGKVYVTGGISVKGPVDDMNINVKLKTGRGTKFYLPLSTSSEASESNYITFVNKDTTKIEEKEEYKVDLSGMNINVDLEIQPEAEFQVIMDETVGDALKAQGAGNLNIKVDKAGEIFIYGLYTVNRGSYLFTLQNLINKKFDVNKGSTIRWSGDPFDAAMDMKAIYKIKKVPLYDLMVDETYKELRTNVECNLAMVGSLLNPEIIFGLNVPDAKEPIPSNINNLTVSDLNRQLLSLLILNKFQPLPGLQSSAGDAGGGSAVSNNAMELLSNQLSNWLSQISDDFDIGINYKQGDEMSSQELDVAMSTQLFNNRVSINTNVGVGGNSTANTSEVEQGAANKIVGDVEIEVKLNKSGSIRSKVFNRTNKSTESGSDDNLYTHGVGVFFRKEFNTVGGLLKDIWQTVTLKKRKERKAKEEDAKRNKEID